MISYAAATATDQYTALWHRSPGYRYIVPAKSARTSSMARTVFFADKNTLRSSSSTDSAGKEDSTAWHGNREVPRRPFRPKRFSTAFPFDSSSFWSSSPILADAESFRKARKRRFRRIRNGQTSRSILQRFLSLTPTPCNYFGRSRQAQSSRGGHAVGDEITVRLTTQAGNYVVIGKPFRWPSSSYVQTAR